MIEPGIDPSTATTAAEFVELLRRVRISAELSYRQIAQRARAHGVALPISTLATALNRDTMPRPEVVTAMLLACGCSREELARWLTARRRIVLGSPSTADGPAPDRSESDVTASDETASDETAPAEAAPEETAPDEAESPEAQARPVAVDPRDRWRRLRARVPLWLILAVVVTAGAGGAWWAAERADHTATPPPTGSPSPTSSPAPSIAAESVRVRPLSGAGCLSEHSGTTGYLFIEPCAQAFPALSTEPAGGGAFRIRTDHPEFGPGCMGVDPVAADDRPSDGYCPDVKHQLFTLVAASGGHLVRNVDLGQCLAVRPEAGSRSVIFADCSAEDPAQLFVIDRV
ncbi:helix-turn-helix domain-containing protein [Hamadaea sp. NPDC051192]|uniref:helix-turn-helix domain-containing protein n=1 Tax=Hamadaea sp. NPDC051192 TaxID=3154940 RepID=UPI00342772BA